MDYQEMGFIACCLSTVLMLINVFLNSRTIRLNEKTIIAQRNTIYLLEERIKILKGD